MTFQGSLPLESKQQTKGKKGVTINEVPTQPSGTWNKSNNKGGYKKGQHLANFLVGHNWKGHCRGNTAKKLVGGSGLERLVAIAAKSQPIESFHHMTFANWIAELWRHEEESSIVGNQKF